MKRLVFFFMLVFSLSICINAQTFEWVKGMVGTVTPRAISLDDNENSYITGSFYGTATFGTTTLTNFSGGFSDIFIAKYDNAGNCVWVKQAGGSFSDFAYGISCDEDGNIYLTGEFKGTVTFGAIELTSYGEWDIFIAKYDNAGRCLWVKQAGGTSDDGGYGIYTDVNGNCYITGHFKGTATFDNITLTSRGNYDIFIAKYDNAGNCLWTEQAGGSSNEIGNGIYTDANGNCYITGYFYATATFDTTILTSYGLWDIFIAKYDNAGNCLWVKQAGGDLGDCGYGISADIFGNCYITGYFGMTATFGTTTLTSSGMYDMFIAKYDNAGNCLWAKKAGSSNGDFGYGIFTTANGNSYLTGYFKGTATFDTTTISSYGNNDIFIAKYGNDGNCLWAKNAGGYSDDYGYGISSSSNSQIYVVGSDGGIANFGGTTLISTGGFVTKILTSSTALDEISQIATEFKLSQNYPNPFNPSTVISYQLPVMCHVSLKVFDMIGNEVATLVNEEKPAGYHTVTFNAENISTGVYFYRLQAGDFVSTRKLVLMK